MPRKAKAKPVEVDEDASSEPIEPSDVAILSRTHGNKDMTPHTRCVR